MAKNISSAEAFRIVSPRKDRSVERETTKQFTVDIPLSLYEKVREASYKNDCPKKRIVEEALQAYLG